MIDDQVVIDVISKLDNHIRASFVTMGLQGILHNDDMPKLIDLGIVSRNEETKELKWTELGEAVFHFLSDQHR